MTTAIQPTLQRSRALPNRNSAWRVFKRTLRNCKPSAIARAFQRRYWALIEHNWRLEIERLEEERTTWGKRMDRAQRDFSAAQMQRVFADVGRPPISYAPGMPSPRRAAERIDAQSRSSSKVLTPFQRAQRARARRTA